LIKSLSKAESLNSKPRCDFMNSRKGYQKLRKSVQDLREVGFESEARRSYIENSYMYDRMNKIMRITGLCFFPTHIIATLYLWNYWQKGTYAQYVAGGFALSSLGVLGAQSLIKSARKKYDLAKIELVASGNRLVKQNGHNNLESGLDSI
jgi:hypothetical protein